MADFTSVLGIASNISSARDIIRIFKNIHHSCNEVAAVLAKYNTDPAFKIEADHLFNAEQLAELGSMAAESQALKNDWENNHRSALGLPPLE